MNHISHFLLLVVKKSQNLNPGDAQLRDIPLGARHPSYQRKKVNTVFNIQTIGCYSFQGSHPVCFSFNTVGAISFIKYITEISSRKPNAVHFQHVCKNALAYTVSLYQSFYFQTCSCSSTMKVAFVFYTYCKLSNKLDKTMVYLKKVSPVTVIVKVSVSVTYLHTSRLLLQM